MMEAGHNPFDQKYFYRDTLSDGELDQDDEFIDNYHMGHLVSQKLRFSSQGQRAVPFFFAGRYPSQELNLL